MYTYASRESKPDKKASDSLPKKTSSGTSSSIQRSAEPLWATTRNLYNRNMIQTSLKVGESNDSYEQEADRVADHIMRMPVPGVQRTCAECASGKTLCPKCAAEKKPKIQRWGTNSAGNMSVPDNFVSNLGRGRPLDSASRSFFEPRFGSDLGNVRVHTGSSAAESARSIGARAYTLGNNIVMGAGEYQPGTIQGKRLMAHELTHVVQQGENSNMGIQRKVEVKSGLNLNTMGYATSKSGNVYTSPNVVKSSIWHELFTSLMHSPRIFKVAGDNNVEINQNFKKHMAARYGVLDFASKKKYTFGAGSAFKMNPKYWSGPLKLKLGVNQQEALEDVNKHPEEYTLACLAATTITMVGGANSNYTNQNSANQKDWIPGDWGYIKNNKFSGKSEDVGLEGENIIYTGNDKYWGHFTGTNTYRTLPEWFSEVEKWNGSAAILDTRRYPIKGLE